jgi:ubiquinone/menaquinone biosynthesis C-methylase UbiE
MLIFCSIKDLVDKITLLTHNFVPKQLNWISMIKNIKGIFFSAIKRHKRYVKYLFLFVVFFLTIFNIFHFKNKRNIYSNYYGMEAINLYESSRSYPYISQFLIPYFLADLSDSDNKNILDAGCGVGLWSIYAAKHGGSVYGIDIQPGMIEQAKKAIIANKVAEKVFLIVGDVTEMPYENRKFDKAISINVACNLEKKVFNKHFQELQRVVKINGTIIFSVPISHEIVFANSTDTELIKRRIQSVLDKLEDNPQPKNFIKILNSLVDVLSATFTIENNRLILITDKNQLKDGQRVWRKLPNITIPNYYYSEDYINKVVLDSKLQVTQVLHPKFEDENKWREYNQSVRNDHEKMSKEYIKNSPFVIYYLKVPKQN